MEEEEFKNNYKNSGKLESKGIILVKGTSIDEDEEEEEEEERRRSPKKKKKEKKDKKKRKRSRSRSMEKRKSKKEKSSKKSKKKRERKSKSPKNQEKEKPMVEKWLMGSSNMSEEERKKFMMLMGAKPEEITSDPIDIIKASKQANEYDKMNDNLEKQFYNGLYRGRAGKRGL